MEKVYWSESAERKMLTYESKYFTIVETRSYIAYLMNSIENILLNPHLSTRYTEEQGKYKGLSRVVFNKFKIYYEKLDNQIIIVAIKFPREK
ncbi:type II toxin-antitoxin system RelE/ParE family toxin [Oceanobacillus halophilus]|uniref:Type II toxin-antitoxin system RelE/ParE family toxin n=1 Tax=Oceanobacillus halophilus TaxID=930130 RepID=A0A495A426_9BACI|nr:type II toxin-antitoxin system RelE/ParE family toxin [Oceanobacillus halophilus]